MDMDKSPETKETPSDVDESQGRKDSTQYNDNNARPGNTNRVIIIAALAVVLVVTVATLAIVSAINKNAETPQPLPSSNIGYSTEAQVILSQEQLQAAMDQAAANAKNGNIGLLYKNNAYSTDGLTFECYIVNSGVNKFDMYLTIFADLDMSDRIFLSQLIPPGSGFNQITLEHALETGDHTVYVCLTQVARDEETGEEYIPGQVFHTMDFHVS